MISDRQIGFTGTKPSRNSCCRGHVRNRPQYSFLFALCWIIDRLGQLVQSLAAAIELFDAIGACLRNDLEQYFVW